MARRASRIRVTDTGAGFFWIYAPVRFEDHAMVTIIQERPDGERIHERCPPGLPGGLWPGAPNGWAAPSTTSGSPLAPAGGPAPPSPTTAPGGKKTARSRSRRCWPSRCCWGPATGSSPTGSTGCTRATWSVQGQQIPPPMRSIHGLGASRDAPKFTCEGRSATGCSSARVMGPHQQLRVPS